MYLATVRGDDAPARFRFAAFERDGRDHVVVEIEARAAQNADVAIVVQRHRAASSGVSVATLPDQSETALPAPAKR
jgi:hypothetical protein